MMKYGRGAVCRRWLMMVICLALLLCSGVVWAGQNPSVRVCNELGEVTIKCHRCSTGEHLGDVVVEAGYNAARDSCVKNMAEAVQQCSRTYNGPVNDIQVRYIYWLGINDWSGEHPNNCQ